MFFSKWVEISAILDKSAITVANAIFTTWICHYSCPRIIQSDNGKEYCNDLLTQLTDLKIKHLKTSPYHPQTNASSERFNRTLLIYLRAYSDSETLNWEEILPVAQLSFNTQIHQSTNFTPYFLIHFMDPSFPYLSLNNDRPIYSDNLSQEALLRLNKYWRMTRHNLELAQLKQKKYYDHLSKNKDFKPGELVLWKRFTFHKGTNKKLLTLWLGPYVITSVPNNCNVFICLTPHSKPRLTLILNIMKAI